MPQPTAVTETIARNVRRLRREHELSARMLGDMCNAAGIDFGRDAIASLESGRRQHVTADQLIVLANVLGTTPMALLAEVPHHPLDAMVTPVQPEVQQLLDPALARARETGLELGDVIDYVRMNFATRRYLRAALEHGPLDMDALQAELDAHGDET